MHPPILYCHLICSRERQGTVWIGCYSATELTHKQTNTCLFTPAGNLESPGHVTCMSLDCVRKQEHLKEKQTQGEHINSKEEGPRSFLMWSDGSNHWATVLPWKPYAAKRHTTSARWMQWTTKHIFSLKYNAVKVLILTKWKYLEWNKKYLTHLTALDSRFCTLKKWSLYRWGPRHWLHD